MAFKTPCGNKTMETYNDSFGSFAVEEQYCGKSADPATEGGDGGCKGPGGIHGDVKIIGLHNRTNIAVFNENGMSHTEIFISQNCFFF